MAFKYYSWNNFQLDCSTSKVLLIRTDLKRNNEVSGEIEWEMKHLQHYFNPDKVPSRKPRHYS